MLANNRSDAGCVSSLAALMQSSEPAPLVGRGWRFRVCTSVYAIGAAPIGNPGWPELALLMLSIDKNLIEFIALSSIFFTLKPPIKIRFIYFIILP